MIPFQTLTYLPAAYVRAEHFLFPCKGNELWQTGVTWTSLYLGTETRAGAREKTFLWVCLGLYLLGLFFFAFPLCNVCFVHLNNIPGTWWLLYYCIAMLKTTDNPLPLGSQPQQWSMGQILAGVSWETAEHLLCLKLCLWPTAGSGLPRCSAWINSPHPAQKGVDFPVSCSSHSPMINPPVRAPALSNWFVCPP